MLLPNYILYPIQNTSYLKKVSYSNQQKNINLLNCNTDYWTTVFINKVIISRVLYQYYVYDLTDVITLINVRARYVTLLSFDQN